MASVAADELEYESDPEEAKLSLTMMRRREASDTEDDDDQEEEEEADELPLKRIDSSVSDTESEGAAADYDDESEEEELAEYEEERIGSEEVEDGRSVNEVLGVDPVNEGVVDGGVYLIDEGQFEDNAAATDADALPDGIGTGEGEGEGGGGGGGEEEKKESEPFAVPTAGAFYMHDDRFRESVGAGRHRYCF